MGIGRVGRPTAYAILVSGLADKITVCDIKSGLAKGFAEELMHSAASLRMDTEVIDCERSMDISGADVILISAGEPRTSGSKVSRRDLAVTNGRIVKEISEDTVHNNPGAKYVMITNPVDAMAMICKKFTGADFVISTGTSPETVRFRSKLARELDLPVSKVQGWVGGEHGEAAVVLWSTAKAYGVPVEEYASHNKIPLDKKQVETYMKEVSRVIIEGVGATEYGPATCFRDIVRAIVKNTDEVLSIATPMKFDEIPEPVFVSAPIRLGWSMGPSLFEFLIEDEKKLLKKAAKTIYATYQSTEASLG